MEGQKQILIRTSTESSPEEIFEDSLSDQTIISRRRDTTRQTPWWKGKMGELANNDFIAIEKKVCLTW